MPTFKTIRQTAAMGFVPEHLLRERLKQGKLPGVYSGNRFLVNVDALVEQLNAESIKNANGVGDSDGNL